MFVHRHKESFNTVSGLSSFFLGEESSFELVLLCKLDPVV
jgi:hypothetical protein